jgi:mono/diheme cytochrome c family protein
MAEVVELSGSQMTPQDLQAIGTYLKAQSGQSSNSDPVPANDPRMQAGAAIYTDVCSACHKKDGTGVAYLIPDLAGAASVSARDPTTVLRVLIEGAQSAATSAEPTPPAMPGTRCQLNDAQIAADATYVRNSCGHASVPVSVSQARKQRKQLSAR